MPATTHWRACVPACLRACVRACVRAGGCVCVCVCVCARTHCIRNSVLRLQADSSLAQVWVSPDSGVATPLVHQVEGLFADSHVTITLIMLGFAAVHSGLAYLRPAGEQVLPPGTHSS